MPVNIHGKQYITVAERVQEAGEEFISLSTEVLYQEPVVIKATVTTKKGTFTGISAANPSKAIEKQSPYEVAETSAVGRALGFAGYGIVEGIATADEMKKTEVPLASESVETEPCDYHKVDMKKLWSEKKQKFYFAHRDNGRGWCFGNGFDDERQTHKENLTRRT